MRILQVYRDYFLLVPGGIERHVYDLAHGLRTVGEVDVLGAARNRRSSTLRDDGVTVHLAAEWARVQGVPLCPGYREVMSRGAYDLIHIHCPNPTGEIGYRLAKTSAVAVATYHADLHRAEFLAPLYRRLLLSTLARCSRVLVSSEQFANTSPVVSAFRERRPDAVEVVPLGVDLERFRSGATEGSSRFRQQWGDGPIVLFVGRMRHYKGVDVLIDALKSGDATLVVAGDGPERARWVELGEAELAGRFVWAGESTEDDLPDVYRAADVFCLPSTSSAETFGLSAVEAMACGLPVITTELGTATSVVNRHGETGFVVPPGDAEELGAAVEKLLTDDSLREAMGKAARDRAVERYGREEMLKRIARVYSDVLEEKSLH